MKLIQGSLSLAVLLSAASAVAQVFVYQDVGGTDLYASTSGGTPGIAGDLVTLANTARTVTDLTVGLRGDMTGATADLSLSFYSPGPPDPDNDGYPTVGAQIGQTITQTAVPVQNGSFNFTFTGVNITVPDNVIWAVSIDNLTQGANLGWTFSEPPTVGSSDPAFAYLGLNNPLSVNVDPNTPPMYNLTAEITAVPEPALYPVLFGLLCLGLAVKHRVRLSPYASA